MERTDLWCEGCESYIAPTATMGWHLATETHRKTVERNREHREWRQARQASAEGIARDQRSWDRARATVRAYLARESGYRQCE